MGPRPWESLVGELKEDKVHLRTQVGRLTEALLSMKKEGYQYQGPGITDSPDPVSLPDDVMQAISETSFGNQELAFDQSIYAQSLLDGGMESGAVAVIIRDGAILETNE